MGACLSSHKVSGSNSNTTTTTTTSTTTTTTSTVNHNRKAAVSQQTTPTTKVAANRQESSQHQHNNNKRNETYKNNRNSQQLNNKDKHNTRRGGAIPCGKRTDFGYAKDFDKRYTIGKLLGHGQFGYTYVATDKANGDRVAVKRIEKNKMILPIAVEDVKREVKILQQLTGHENVVHFHNAFEDDYYVYIVMELCEGGELLDRILAKTIIYFYLHHSNQEG